MTFLLNLLDQPKEFAIECDKAPHNPQSVPDLLSLPRRKDHAYGRLGRAFHHVLALFIEAGCDGIVFFEGDEQGRQRRLVVVTGFDVISGLLEAQSGELLNTPQPLEPGAISSIAEPAQQLAVAHLPITAFAFQRLLDTLR